MNRERGMRGRRREAYASQKVLVKRFQYIVLLELT